VHVVLEQQGSPGAVRTPRSPALARLAHFTDGLDRLPRLLAPFAPEAVASAVGIAASDIRVLAAQFAGARTAVCYGRMGVCTQPFGTLTTWLIDVLNIVTGNLDHPGGAMFPTAAVDLSALAERFGHAGSFARWHSRVSRLPEFGGELPVSCLAEEMETPGAGQVRALVTYAGNPALSLPNGRRLERAFAGLEFMVAIDLYRNETTRHAHLILPKSFGLEHDHYPLMHHTLAIRNTAKYSEAVIPPPPGALHDWQVLLELSARLLARASLPGAVVAPIVRRLGRMFGPHTILRLALRFGPYGKRWNPFARGISLDQLRATPHGLDLGALESRLPSALKTRLRRIQLTPEPMLADLDRLAARLRSHQCNPATERGPLVLIGRRHLRSNNSWMHNSLRLVKGKNRCILLIHPADADVRGVRTGDRVRVASRVGELEVEAGVTDEMMPGVVSLPHGWGHGASGANLSVADRHAGVNVNLLTDDALIDRLSGCSSLNGVPVTVALTSSRS
jgi:anaerobic selenocysteine-containing dehydrogenase